jgi:hypothetical protein
MSRRLLIISPKFPPVSSPDLHRVRTSLSHYRSCGWQPTVLSISPETSEGVDDPLLAESIGKDEEIVRVPAWNEALCRKFGFGLLEYRALLPLYRAGNRLLAERKYDVIFFSTTAFLTLALGPLWKSRFGTKLVYDIQDPWYHGAEDPYSPSNAPGGWARYRLSQNIAKFAERFAMQAADGIISVSPGYVDMLCRRYAFLNAGMFDIVPFGVAREDYAIANRLNATPEIRDVRRLVSVGRGGVDMEEILAVFFSQLAALRKKKPETASSLRIDFIGTNYASAGRSQKLVTPIAARYGLDGMVTEKSERIPYFEALAAYTASDGILLFGSTSPDYVASKLFNCVASAKPILAMVRASSFMAKVGATFPNIRLATFAASPEETSFADAIAEGLIDLSAVRFTESEIERALAPWSAETLTKRQCQSFDRACDHAA